MDPNLNKTDWTIEEDLKLILTEQKIGKKWSQLAKVLVGRTENAIKNRRNSLLKKAKNALFDEKSVKNPNLVKLKLEYQKMEKMQKEKFLQLEILKKKKNELKEKQLLN